MELKRTSTGRQAITLSGAMPKQPITLTEYQIRLASADGTVDALFVQLPFLNHFDINTNYPVPNAIPFFHDPSKASTHGKVEYEFNPARNIDEVISNTQWNVYDESGVEYTNRNYTLTLVFNYRRSEQI